MSEDLDVAHENNVDEFLRRAAQNGDAPLTDAQFADWLNRHPYPILTEDQLAWRRSREVRLTESFENTISLCSNIFGRRVAAPLV